LPTFLIFSCLKSADLGAFRVLFDKKKIKRWAEVKIYPVMIVKKVTRLIKAHRQKSDVLRLSFLLLRTIVLCL